MKICRKSLFRKLELPEPNYNIEMGSLPNSLQTGKMVVALYDIIIKNTPQIILAQGEYKHRICCCLIGL